ncbi:MAG: COX15/CtaA family protein [Verrucomicrobiota bacterium]
MTALTTLGLVGMGGLVTSHGVGMAVPDWPTSYGYNMFALPISTWLTGGIFHEHTHRLWASFVGVLVVALTRWLGGRAACFPLLIIGAVEILMGISLLQLGVDWKGAGHFLAGIGGVVLLGGLVWFSNAPLTALANFAKAMSVKWAWFGGFAAKLARFAETTNVKLAWLNNAPAVKPLPVLGWAAFWLVQLQGLLGGLRVVLDAHVLADVRLGTAFGIFHGCLGQAFLVLTAVIALMTSRWWQSQSARGLVGGGDDGVVQRWFLVATGLISLQLLIAATMRHQHAGLAIPDFPLAYGRIWPDMSEAAVAKYNLLRVEVTSVHPITAFQIVLQLVHRIVAVLITVAVAVCLVKSDRGTPLRRVASGWLGLILIQIALGAWTIWSNKAADVATAHVVVGALSLVTGALACLISFRRFTGNVPSPAVALAQTAVANRGSV